jgi:hypothetical protein
MVHVVDHFSKSAGLSALFKGVSPAMVRGLVYGGLRIGMYSPIKSWLTGEGKKANMQSKLISGCASGAIAAAITNPFELVRTSSARHGGTVILFHVENATLLDTVVSCISAPERILSRVTVCPCDILPSAFPVPHRSEQRDFDSIHSIGGIFHVCSPVCRHTLKAGWCIRSE